MSSAGIPILLNKNVLDAINFNWKADKDTMFYVIDRQAGGLVSTYKVDL